MSNIKILVVNDHGILRDGIRAMFRSHGDIRIIGEACEGSESVDKVRELSPEIVLMDPSLPDIDGLEIVRRIKKQSLPVKVLALVRYEDEEYVSSVLKAGVAGCISMRSGSAELVKAIRTLHNGNKYLCTRATKILIENYSRLADKNVHDLLTPSEKETLKFMAESNCGRNIAAKLGISLSALNGRLSNMRKKLGFRNTTQLIKYAVGKGLLATEGRVTNAGS